VHESNIYDSVTSASEQHKYKSFQLLVIRQSTKKIKNADIAAKGGHYHQK